MKINLHIERVVLDGLPVESRQSALIQAAIQAELEQQLTETGLSSELMAGGAIASLNARSIPITSEATPPQFGQRIAEAVHGAIRREPATGPSTSPIRPLRHLAVIIVIMLSVWLGRAQVNYVLSIGEPALQTSEARKKAVTKVQDAQARTRTDVNPGQQDVPHLNLRVDRNVSQTGEEITISLEPVNLVTASAYIFICNFGDGDKMEFPRDGSALTHVYRKAGLHKITVDVTTKLGSEIFDPKPVVDNQVEVTVNRFSLVVEPSKGETGQTVSFRVEPVSKDPDIRYLFDFDDDSVKNEWQTDAVARHAYSSNGVYRPRVVIGRFLESDGGVETIDLIAAKPNTVTISKSPTPIPTSTETTTPIPTPTPIDKWPILVFGGAAILILGASVPFLAYKIWNGRRPIHHGVDGGHAPPAMPEPTFQAQPDRGNPGVTTVSQPLIDFQISLRSGAAEALSRLTAEEPLVRAVRRANV